MKWFWACVVAVCVGAGSALADDPAELAKRLHHAAEMSSIDDPALKPWHLKMSFQLLDKKGATAEEGTIEEWWSAPNYKRIYTSPSYAATEIRRDGKFYRTKGKSLAPQVLETLQHEVIHPIPSDIDRNKVGPELRVEPFGKVKLDCMMLSPTSNREPFLPLGSSPTYCFSQDNNTYRVSLRLDSEDITRVDIGTFQGRAVPVDIRFTAHGVPSAKAHITELSGIPTDDKLFEIDDSAQLQEIGAVPQDFGVVPASKISGVPPIYPQQDKVNHMSGSVHVRAVIGVDGRVRDLTVLDSPSSTLAASAVAAVQQLVYKPATLNGIPCAVETVVTIRYNFSGG